VNTVSDRVLRHSLAYLSVQKWFAGNVLYYVKIWPNLPLSNQMGLKKAKCPKFER